MAQALEEDMVIVTRDAAIARYAVPTLLAEHPASRGRVLLRLGWRVPR